VTDAERTYRVSYQSSAWEVCWILYVIADDGVGWIAACPEFAVLTLAVNHQIFYRETGTIQTDLKKGTWHWCSYRQTTVRTMLVGAAGSNKLRGAPRCFKGTIICILEGQSP
jgi:hypothetical protein